MNKNYKGGTDDDAIVGAITARIENVLNDNFGSGARLLEKRSEIIEYTSSIFLRFAAILPTHDNAHILVKIRRHPKMRSLKEALAATDIHLKMPHEYAAQQATFELFKGRSDGLRAVHPLAYLDEYHALIMVEFAGKTMRQLLMSTARPFSGQSEHESLRSAAHKAGQWLHELHAGRDCVSTVEFSKEQFDMEIDPYIDELGRCGVRQHMLDHLRASFVSNFPKLKGRPLLSSNSHDDYTTDNILYNRNGEIAVIDIKTRIAPAYRDLTLLMIHPETYRSRLLSFGLFPRKPILRSFRTSILNGYFADDKPDEILLNFYCARNLLDKWLMYERIMLNHTGIKRLRSSLIKPQIRAYFLRQTINYLHAAAS